DLSHQLGVKSIPPGASKIGRSGRTIDCLLPGRRSLSFFRGNWTNHNSANLRIRGRCATQPGRDGAVTTIALMFSGANHQSLHQRQVTDMPKQLITNENSFPGGECVARGSNHHSFVKTQGRDSVRVWWD